MLTGGELHEKMDNTLVLLALLGTKTGNRETASLAPFKITKSICHLSYINKIKHKYHKSAPSQETIWHITQLKAVVCLFYALAFTGIIQTC